MCYKRETYCKAVARMWNKCEQQTATVVSEATRSLSHQFKKSDRLGSVLQSKLDKAEVPRPLALNICQSCLT